MTRDFVPKRLLISFSGGETSAYMTWWLLKNAAHLWDEIKIVFANTSQEHENTLIFVERCDRELFAPLGHRVVWIEAVQHHNERKSASARVVSFDTAARDGSVFEDMIRKYGIPNQKFKACTRALKLRPIEDCCETVFGWAKNSYQTAIGIRADEIDRVSEERHARQIIYPLIEMIKRTKPQINTWWSFQPFRLGLKGYQGNCAWCWKKSLRKHLTLIDTTPEIYDFPARMENQYGTTGPEFLKPGLPSDYRRVFFRGNLSVRDLFEQHASKKAAGNLVLADDDAAVYDYELDTGAACGEESCEVFSDETDEMDV